MWENHLDVEKWLMGLSSGQKRDFYDWLEVKIAEKTDPLEKEIHTITNEKNAEIKKLNEFIDQLNHKISILESTNKLLSNLIEKFKMLVDAKK